jgi:hypothetical protein
MVGYDGGPKDARRPIERLLIVLTFVAILAVLLSVAFR